jgi:RimJ/RimL family protein N-acetyltransferase
LDILATERLRLRTATLDDAAFYHALVNDPAFIEHIGDRGIRTLEQARQSVLDGPIAMQVQRGHSLYVVELNTDATPIGMPAWRGLGYALEAARGVLAYAPTLGLRRVLAITSPNNIASNRLLLKLGMQFEHFMHLTPEDAGTNLYSIEVGAY